MFGIIVSRKPLVRDAIKRLAFSIETLQIVPRFYEQTGTGGLKSFSKMVGKLVGMLVGILPPPKILLGLNTHADEAAKTTRYKVTSVTALYIYYSVSYFTAQIQIHAQFPQL